MSIADEVKNQIAHAKKTGISPEFLIQPTSAIIFIPENFKESQHYNSPIHDAEYSVNHETNNQQCTEYYRNYNYDINNHRKDSISPAVHEHIKRIDKSGIPSSLNSHNKLLFFPALVVEYFYLHTTKKLRAECIYAFGGNESEARNLSEFHKPDHVIKFISEKINRSTLVSSLALGYYLKINPEYCFNTFSYTKVNIENYNFQEIEEVIPTRINAHEISYELKVKIKLRNFNGTVEQIVCYYSSDDKDIYAVATRVQDTTGKICIKIGGAPATAWLLSRVLMSHHPSADVLICTDIRLAIQFCQIARESCLLDLTGAIITGYIGGDDALKNLVLNDVAGHRAIILSSPGQEGWKTLEKLAKRCVDNGATQVDIYPWPLMNDHNLTVTSPSDAAHEDLSEKIDDLRYTERPSMLVKKIQERAMPLDVFEAWKKRKEKEASADNTPTSVDDTKFRITYFPDIVDAKLLNQKHPLSVSDLLTAIYSTLIWGYSNVGKTFVAEELAVSISTGTSCFFLSASVASKVCYIGGESDASIFKSQCAQLMKRRLKYLDLLDKNLGSHVVKGGLDILEDNQQVEIIDWLLNEKTKYLFIDNIISLAPSSTNNDPSSLFRFVNKIEKLGIAVILIHHANKVKKDVKGSVDLVSRCQNVLKLEGRDQFAEETTHSVAMKTALAEDGPVTRITVDKCKVAPHFERKSIVYRLPVSGTWEWVEGDIINECDTSDAHAINTSLKSFNNTSILDPHLPPDAEKILSVMDNNTSYYRSDLEKATGFKEDRIRKNLTLLIEAGLVIREGEGKGTYYRKA